MHIKVGAVRLGHLEHIENTKVWEITTIGFAIDVPLYNSYCII